MFCRLLFLNVFYLAYPRSAPLLAALALSLGGLGCARIASRPGPALAEAPVPSVSGIWEGLFRSTLAEGVGTGDTRIERQAWRLSQTGTEISGFYVVDLTMVSADGRAYLCSRTPQFSTLLRFDLRGRVVGGVVEIEEVGEPRGKGPCRPTARPPARFRAAIKGDVMTLSDEGQRMTLFRRPAREQVSAENALLAFARPDASWDADPVFPSLGGGHIQEASGPTPNVHGLWLWEHHGSVAAGDEKVEREEWHLRQDGAKISGYYDRTVRQISTDGQAYRCNSSLDFRVLTRYQIAGEIRGDQIVLYERGFEILEGGPCDTGRRRLDAYQGQAATGEIRLLWGVATQVLKRARPNVPTQRF